MDSRWINYFRLLMMLILVIMASLLIGGTFRYTRNDERQNFEAAFHALADEVIDSFHASVSNQLAAMDALSVSYTSYALTTGSTFPNITLPHYEIKGANTRIISHGFIAHFFPLITDENRRGWEEYATETWGHQMASFASQTKLSAAQDIKYGYDPMPAKLVAGGSGSRALMLEEEVEEQEEVGGEFSTLHQLQDAYFGLEDREHIERELQGVAPLTRPFSPVIVDDYGVEEAEGTGPFFPLWQSTPTVPVPGLLTLNCLRYPLLTEGILRVLETNEAYMHSGIVNDEFFNLYLPRGQFRHRNDTVLLDAATPLGYPVFDSFDLATRKLVAVLSANIYWRLYFRNILPENSVGVIVVLKNTADQVFTYRIDGKEVTYLAPEDLHDSKYNSLEVSADVAAYLKAQTGPETQGYTAVDVNEDGVRYFLHIYPSDDMREEYETNKPAVYAAVVAVAFIVTCSMFLLYDCVVGRRQKSMMAQIKLTNQQEKGSGETPPPPEKEGHEVTPPTKVTTELN